MAPSKDEIAINADLHLEQPLDAGGRSPETPGQFGNSGRNILIGPSFSRVDLGLAKVLKLAGRVNLHLRAEAFNAFNTVSFTGLNTTVRFDATGNPAGGYAQVTSAAPGRVLEFGARLTF